MYQAKPDPTRASESDINIREEIEKYLRHWPWFVLSVLIALGFAYLKLRQTTPIYSTSATILIMDGKKSQSSEMAAFAELGLIGAVSSNSIENEIGILSSRRLMERVVRSLNYNVQYFDGVQLRNPELYTETPILAKLIAMDEVKLQNSPGNTFRINYRGGDKLEITRIADEKVIKGNLDQPVDLGFTQVIFTENKLISETGKNKEIDILIKFNSFKMVASSYLKKLTVIIKEKNASLIELTLNDPIRNKAEDILDQLILEYNSEAIGDKNIVGMNTAEFIEERLMIINEELNAVETGKLEFKEENQLTDIQGESQLFISSANEFKGRQQDLGTQIELAEAMISYLKSSASGELLPANLGIEESAVNQEINYYNDLVLERNKVLSGSTEINPVVIRLNRQIGEIRGNTLLSLNRLKSNLEIAEENLNIRAASIGAQISAVPLKEKKFRSIERQQQIKETLFLFLLQKREENSLSLAVNAPKAKVVDAALSSPIPISPISRNLYLSSLLIGLGLPFAFLYLKSVFNNKVRGREDVERRVLDIPVVAEIPRIRRGQKEIIENNDRSVLAESFRILHTNLQYLLVNVEEKQMGKIILVTSTIKWEGKTFAAFNLALTLAYANKKVLILGGDLRNPQLQRFEENARDYLGVSDYLVNKDLELRELIKTSELNSNLDFFTSGSIPPNPSELWRQDRAIQMFHELKELYDYVIVDSAPAMLVTDTFIINKFADLTLYIVRAGYTRIKLLDFPVESKNKGKLGEVAYVLNSVESAQYGYGTKYGYYYAYGEDKNGFWDKLNSKISIW